MLASAVHQSTQINACEKRSARRERHLMLHFNGVEQKDEQFFFFLYCSSPACPLQDEEHATRLTHELLYLRGMDNNIQVTIPASKHQFLDADDIRWRRQCDGRHLQAIRVNESGSWCILVPEVTTMYECPVTSLRVLQC